MWVQQYSLMVPRSPAEDRLWIPALKNAPHSTVTCERPALSDAPMAFNLQSDALHISLTL